MCPNTPSLADEHLHGKRTCSIVRTEYEGTGSRVMGWNLHRYVILTSACGEVVFVISRGEDGVQFVMRVTIRQLRFPHTLRNLMQRANGAVCGNSAERQKSKLVDCQAFLGNRRWRRVAAPGNITVRFVHGPRWSEGRKRVFQMRKRIGNAMKVVPIGEYELGQCTTLDGLCQCPTKMETRDAR